MQSKSNEQQLIKVRGYFSHCLFPKPPVILGEEGHNYGVTVWEVEEILEGNPTMRKNQEITVVGEFYEPPKTGILYTILASETVHSTYGTQYTLLYINEQIDLQKMVNQKAFLSSFLTAGQIEEMYKVLESPIQTIAAYDVDSLKKVHGIGDYIANAIVERYEKNRDYSRIYIELVDYGFSPKFIQKLIKKYRDPGLLIKVVKEHPYQLITDLDGVGFRIADTIALKGGMKPTATERVEAYIIYFLRSEAEENGNSYVTAGELLSNLYTFFGGRDKITELFYNEKGEVIDSNINQAITTLQNQQTIVVEKGQNKSTRRVYLEYYYDLERKIAFHLNRLLKGKNDFDYENWEEKVKQLEKRQGFEFSKTQKDGIKLGLDSQVCFINGEAGSGKSSLVAGILAALDEYYFVQTALSGRAAARLQEITGVGGCTIHRLLGYKPGMGFTFNEENPIPADIVILDELSLVGGEIFLDLIKAIPTGSKLIMLGDLGQLEAIGALNLASDMSFSSEIPSVELKEIHRQAAKSGILSSAHEVRNGRQLFSQQEEGVKTMGVLEDMFFDLNLEKDEIRFKCLSWFKKMYASDWVKKNPMNIQVISPVKERGDSCVYNLNCDIQDFLNPPNRGDAEFSAGGKNTPYHIRVGDKVMCIKNNYKTTKFTGKDKLQKNEEICPMFNGWVGIVKLINQEEGYIVVDFSLTEGELRIKYEDAMSNLVLGYVSTVHKLQGSDAPVIIGALDYGTPPMMLTRQLLYTLLTRAKKSCIVVAQTPALNKAISNDFVSQKRTFLPELLTEIVGAGQ